jgi:hypothetical protein
MWEKGGATLAGCCDKFVAWGGLLKMRQLPLAATVLWLFEGARRSSTQRDSA